MFRSLVTLCLISQIGTLYSEICTSISLIHVFYSIQYNERDVQRRIGEDYAYNEKLQKFNEDILIKSLNAIGKDETPVSFKNGILNVTATMYIAVDEELWFELFKESVFKAFIRRLQEIKDSDELVFNVKFALGSIRKPDNIYWAFQQLISRYSMNNGVVSDIIVNNLLIQYNQKEVKINDTLLFPNVLDRNTLFLLDTLNNEGFYQKSSSLQFVKLFTKQVFKIFHTIG